MYKSVKIKKKYNVTIPKSVRKKFELKIGQLVQVSIEGNKIVLKPLPSDPSGKLEKLIGSLKAEGMKGEAEKIILKEAKLGLARKLKQR
jgi:AbrB family looped-hinge helix DNA binding protein